jgi:hypothetical protein
MPAHTVPPMDTMRVAVDQAGRYAMVNTSATSSQIVAVAQANLYGFNPNSFTVTATTQTSGGINYEVITITYPFNFVTPGVLPFGSITLTRGTTVPLVM